MDEPHIHTSDMDIINKFIYKDLDIFKHNDVNEKYSFIEFGKGWTTNVPKTLKSMLKKKKKINQKLIVYMTRP